MLQLIKTTLSLSVFFCVIGCDGCSARQFDGFTVQDTALADGQPVPDGIAPPDLSSNSDGSGPDKGPANCRRAEVLLVLDTSGSMAWSIGSKPVGADCGGDQKGSVDLCGDGMCTGSEGGAKNKCAQDCNVSNPLVPAPGTPPACNADQLSTSRIYMVKRGLRIVLHELEQWASFGLVTFKQTGYFRYYKARTGAGSGSRKVAVFLSRAELKQLGAWDQTSDRPRGSFKRHGVTYYLLSTQKDKWQITVDRDSLYGRQDKPTVEDRFTFASAGLKHSADANSWIYRGSYYVYDQAETDITSVKVATDYLGPQYVDSAGQTWVYHRYYHDYYQAQGISGVSAGRVVVPLASDPSQQPKVAQSLARILGLVNVASNGGLWPTGGTPTGEALEVAHQHFVDRHLGVGIYASTGADPEGAKRRRLVLLLTDGQFSGTKDPVVVAKALYADPRFGSNPVKILVVGLPGLPSSATTNLDRIADLGDDGLENNSSSAHAATSELQLLAVIKKALAGVGSCGK